MKRYSIFLLALFVALTLVLIGCGESGGDGYSLWEREASRAAESDSGDYADQSGLEQAIYADLCGAYANPGGSYRLLLLYADGTYVLDDLEDIAYGDYTADAAAMTIALRGQGTWNIGSGFAYVVDGKGDPWAKILEDILKDAGSDGAEDEVKENRKKIDDIFTEEELEEMDRQAMKELEGNRRDGARAADYSPADVAATYGHPKVGDFQLTLYANGTYEDAHGLSYACGLFTIEGDTIYFWEDPTQELTALPWIGDSATIGDKGLTLIDQESDVWRREAKRETDPYDPGAW